MNGRYAAAVAALLVGVLGACGGDDSGDDGRQLSAEARRGRDLADDNGCQSCHRPDGIGPQWEGLYGSEVELADGSTVVADDEYLARSINDPGADVVVGYNVRMPNNRLGEEQVASIVAYIRELADTESAEP